MAEGHVCGGILPEKIFEIRSPEMPFPALWAQKRTKKRKNAQKIKKLLTIIYHYLVVEKRNNLNRFC
jgi:hypothetical protein